MMDVAIAAGTIVLAAIAVWAVFEGTREPEQPGYCSTCGCAWACTHDCC